MRTVGSAGSPDGRLPERLLRLRRSTCRLLSSSHCCGMAPLQVAVAAGVCRGPSWRAGCCCPSPTTHRRFGSLANLGAPQAHAAAGRVPCTAARSTPKALFLAPPPSPPPLSPQVVALQINVAYGWGQAWQRPRQAVALQLQRLELEQGEEVGQGAAEGLRGVGAPSERASGGGKGRVQCRAGCLGLLGSAQAISLLTMKSLEGSQ